MFIWVFTHRPHPDDPNRMYFDFWNLVRAPAPAHPAPRDASCFRVEDGDSLAGTCAGGERDRRGPVQPPAHPGGHALARVRGAAPRHAGGPHPALPRHARCATSAGAGAWLSMALEWIAAALRRAGRGPRCRGVVRGSSSSCAAPRARSTRSRTAARTPRSRSPTGRARGLRPRVPAATAAGSTCATGGPLAAPIRRARPSLRRARGGPARIEVTARAASDLPGRTRCTTS